MTNEIPADATADVVDPGEAVGWLELFFDLVVVAAVAVLTHGLREDPSAAGIGLFVVLYAAIWMTWINVVLYADVAGESTRLRTVLAVMALIAVMAATSPLHHEARADAFAVAFLLARVWIGRRALQSGRMLSSWPLLQSSGFSIPWIVSLWVEAPAKFWLWALAIGIDLVMVVVRGDEMAERRERREPRGHEPRRPALTRVGMNAEHVDERLGLLVIIVLGEAVAQLVAAGAEVTWGRHFGTIALGGFAVLVGLWLLTFAFGYSASPRAALVTLPPRIGLPLHLLSTLGVLFLAAGLGELAADYREPLHGTLLWLMCGGLALHFGVGALSGFLTGAPPHWLWLYAVPTALVPLLVPALVAVVGEEIGNGLLVWLLVVPIAWQVVYARRRFPGSSPQPAA